MLDLVIPPEVGLGASSEGVNPRRSFCYAQRKFGTSFLPTRVGERMSNLVFFGLTG
jgi:hypothetical protein